MTEMDEVRLKKKRILSSEHENESTGLAVIFMDT
jgi:hypothetical protein